MLNAEPDHDYDTEAVMELLLEQDDMDWKALIRELIREEDMDPWNLDVKVVSRKFLTLLSEMQEYDFRLSGKMILAAAFFLKIKSDKLLTEDIHELDTMMEPDDFHDEFDDIEPPKFADENPELIPRTPQPRRRKVSVEDLASALEKALQKEQKTYMRNAYKARKQAEEDELGSMEAPEKKRDISEVIDEVYTKVVTHLKKIRRVTFKHMIENENRDHKVQTFVPLLHLDNQGKVNLHQEEHFGDIEVKVDEDNQ